MMSSRQFLISKEDSGLAVSAMLKGIRWIVVANFSKYTRKLTIRGRGTSSGLRFIRTKNYWKTEQLVV